MRRTTVTFVMLACLLGVGCGGQKELPPADPEKARDALTTALDAWRQGEPSASLTQRTPPFHVADEDWLSGARLERYEVKGDGEMMGSSLRCTVVLHLKDSKGRPIAPRTVLYQVTTTPTISVVRFDSP